MKNKNDAFCDAVIGILGAIFIMLIIIVFGQYAKSNHNEMAEPEVIIQKQQDSIVTLNNKLDSLKVEFIKDSYEAKLLNDSDAVELFYELLKH